MDLDMNSRRAPGRQPRRVLAIQDMLNHHHQPPRLYPPPNPQALEIFPISGPRTFVPIPAQGTPPFSSHSDPDFLHGDGRRILPFTSLPGRDMDPQCQPPPNWGENWGDDNHIHMSHPGMTTEQYTYQPQTAPPRSLIPPAPITQPEVSANADLDTNRTCSICLKKYEGELEIQFPYKCHKCASTFYCTNCLRNWVLGACKDESKMPPKCCSIIPLSVLSKLLNAAQIELYKAKYEEWSTPDRLYCPVPNCSAFIPPRLYVNPTTTKPKVPSSVRSTARLSAVPFAHIENPYATEAADLPAKKDIMPNVACPVCRVSVCTKCRSFTHFGTCPESDLDPALEAQLKKWKIKRCPKCRAGIRKVFGCPHIACRCGAHFCFECLLPIQECDGSCGEDSDTEVDDNPEEDDLDGRANLYEGDGHEFGPEPYGNAVDSWGCQHEFMPSGSQASNECNFCFRHVYSEIQENVKILKEDEDVEMTGMSESWPTNIHNEPVWQCFTGHIKCDHCPKLPPPHRTDDPSWLWACDCRMSCEACDKLQALRKHQEEKYLFAQLREKEDRKAWECRCGLIVCGACKVLSASHDVDDYGLVQ